MSAAARWLRAGQAGVAGFALGLLLFASLSEAAYWKDIQVEYLTAKALRDGVDILTPVSELSARYFPIVTDNFPHPSPHPPVLALLGLPLTLLPFRVFAPLWLAFNVWLLIVVGRWLRISLPGTLAMAAWPPLWYLLLIGQLELVILALAMLGWRAAAAGRDWSAGGWLGLASAIKLYPAVLLLPFVVRRRGRVLVAAAAVLVLSQIGSVAAAGVEGFVRYYHEVLPAVAAHYTGVGLNMAPYGAFLRLFGGAADVEPIVNAPALVLPMAVALAGAALMALAWMEPEAGPVALLVGLPSVWYWYPVLALPPIAALLRSRLRRLAFLAVLASSLVLPLVNSLLRRIVSDPTEWTGGHAPSVAALLGAIQPAGFIGLLVLTVALTVADPWSPKR